METLSVTRSSIHPATRIGQVSLKVADLQSQIKFYQNLLGFKLHWSTDAAAGLGAGGADLVVLHHQPGGRRLARTAGLYHFAVLFPNRRELARAMARLFQAGYVNHPTDHIMTKTTYLRDPEGQEIELYAESPEDGTMSFVDGRFAATRADGSASDGREPLDVEALLANLLPNDDLAAPLPPETTIGHVHLYMSHLDQAITFYSDVIGFDLMGAAPAYQAAFVSAGGYHHHLGLNTWMGEGAPPAPAGALGMDYFTVIVPNQAELDVVLARVAAAGLVAQSTDVGWRLTDPSGNDVALQVEGLHGH